MGVDIIARGMAGNDAHRIADLETIVELLKKGMMYKGEVDYVSDLPATGNTEGDVWTVKYKGESGTEPSGAEYVWGDYQGTLQWLVLTPALALVAITGSYNDLIDKPVIPEYPASDTVAWNKYTNGGSTNNITLPAFGTPTGTQSLVYSFLSSGATATFTAPNDAMIIGAEYPSQYATGNSITCDVYDLTLYIVKFSCFTAAGYKFITFDAIGHEVDFID